MFETTATRTVLPLRVLRKLCLLVAAAYVMIGLTAGYRAYHQIKSVDLEAPKMLRAGTSIDTSVVTYGRTFVDVRLDLIQGQRSEVLSVHRIPSNNWAFMDPRTRRISHSTLLTDFISRKFQAGSATLRVTATGLRQLGHVPPPIVHETVVEIQRD